MKASMSFPTFVIIVLIILLVLVLAALRVRLQWTRINGRLRMKTIVIAWSCRFSLGVDGAPGARGRALPDTDRNRELGALRLIWSAW